MAPKRSVFSERTLVPVGFVVVVLGGSFWVASLRADVSQHGKDIVDLKTEHAADAKVDDAVKREVLDRLARIEEQVKYLYDDARARNH